VTMPDLPEDPQQPAAAAPDGPARIEHGSRVTLHLALTLDDGTEVLSTVGADPLSFTIGDGTLAPGLEPLLLGLTVGTDTWLLAEGEAVFGAHDPGLVHELPRSDLPADFAPEPGQVIGFSTPGGQETPGTVLAAAADTVRVDFNHPLARRWLKLRVQVLGIG
jgi:FKBP-type peptidyl-prolyl cis-trans isomerase SlpA